MSGQFSHVRRMSAVLLLCLGCWGCGFQVSSGNSVTQLKALSQVLSETNVQTCSRVVAAFPPYIQVTSTWAGRIPMEECLKALYPY
jgi:hypothetical protein